MTKKRRVNMHAELRHTSRVLLEAGEEREEGSFHQFMASLVFTAFMTEAYLNHIGRHLFKSWDDLERLPPMSKLHVIAERLGIDRAQVGLYRILPDLFRFRNTLAHGKSESLGPRTVIVALRESEAIETEFLTTPWEDYCTKERAKAALQDAETGIKQLHRLAGMREPAFFSGLHETYSEVLPDD